jgi:hypothetical protein
VNGLREWMETRAFNSIGDFKGQFAAAHLADPSAFMQVHYDDILTTDHKKPW